MDFYLVHTHRCRDLCETVYLNSIHKTYVVFRPDFSILNVISTRILSLNTDLKSTFNSNSLPLVILWIIKISKVIILTIIF